VALAMILREGFDKNSAPGGWIDASLVMGLLFFSVLLHEFGHCFAARSVNGDAQEVLLWPLGGLANVEVPHTPRANLIVAAGGPAVNLVLALLSTLLLWGFFSAAPSFSLEGYNGRGSDGFVTVKLWSVDTHGESPYRA